MSILTSVHLSKFSGAIITALVAILLAASWGLISHPKPGPPEALSARAKRHQVLLAGGIPGGMPKDWRVTLSEAERGAVFPLLVPNHPLANQENITDVYLFPQGGEVSLLFPVPSGDSTTDPTRPPFIEILEEPWTGGDPIQDYKQDIADTPDIGKSICQIDEQTPALCVDARSPSDSVGNNGAYLRFVTGGVQVQLVGGEQLQRLMDIAKTLTEAGTSRS